MTHKIRQQVNEQRASANDVFFGEKSINDVYIHYKKAEIQIICYT